MVHQFFAHSQLLLLNHQPWSSPPASLGIARMSQEEVAVSFSTRLDLFIPILINAGYYQGRSLVLIRNIIGTALTHSESASSTCFIATLAVTSGMSTELSLSRCLLMLTLSLRWTLAQRPPVSGARSWALAPSTERMCRPRPHL